jgi:hypothetical protein
MAIRFGANARQAGLTFDRAVQVARYMDLFRELLPARQRGRGLAGAEAVGS